MTRRLLSLCVFAYLFAPCSPAAAQCGGPGASNEVHYTILFAGNKAGVETSKRNPDGSLRYYYEFNDRGRGPKITETVLVDAQGLPTEIRSSGNDYEKAPVDEHFSLKDSTASWKNRSEEGSRSNARRAFYASISGAPEESALLARALLAAGGRLSLLPEGEASIEKRGTQQVSANGQTRTVVQYAIGGLDFTPDPVWLDGDGTFFAVASPWFTVIREGWESAADALIKAQDEFANRRSAELAKRLAHKPSGTLAIVHANLFDTETATVKPYATVVITGDRITNVSTDPNYKVPQGAELIDAKGKMLMPGLWDCHVHLGPNDGLLNMAAGVTQVRDMANDIDMLGAMTRRFDEGTEIGPRVLKAGFVDGRGPYQGPTKVFADNVEEAKADIDRYVQLGYVQIKVYSSLKPELVAPIAKMTHEHGLRLSGHVPAFMSAQQFIEAGADEMQHMNFVFLNFMFDRVKDTRARARFTEVGAHAAEIDPASPQVQAFIHLMQEHHTVLDPTLAIFEGMFTDRPGKMAVGYAAVADRLPAQIRRGFFYGGIEVPEGMDQRYRDSFTQMKKMLKTMYDAGIPIVAGTDALAGFTLHRELEVYVDAGIPAPKVLQLDTLGAARVMKRDKEEGSIAPGKLADMILIDGDPSRNISDIRKIVTTIKGGVVYQNAQLDEALGVKPAAIGPQAGSRMEVLSDTKGVDFGPYLQGVLHAVRKNWYAVIPHPQLAQGEVSIEFAISKEGRVAGLRLVGSSGDAVLDRAALAGITASDPFVALPKEYDGSNLALRLHFYYNPNRTPTTDK